MENFTIFDPFDLDSPDFNFELYMNKLFKEYEISKLMENEQTLFKKTQSLDSEMQTLVYENYNKFINATDTIKKMDTNFELIEEQLSLLSTKMDKITNSSEEISKNLKNKRQDLTKLANKHTVLQKLQFLFDLNSKMNSFINHKEFTEAVRYYLSAKNALKKYENFKSIKTIKDECDLTLEILKEKLNEQLKLVEFNQQSQISEYIDLLLQINEPPEKLVDQYLSFAKTILQKSLDVLDYHTKFLQEYYKKDNVSDEEMVPMDILEFIDLSCNSYLSSITEIVLNYEEIFIKSNSSYFTDEDIIMIKSKLEKFIIINMSIFFEKVILRFEIDKSSLDEISFYIRSMDRFYRRITNLENIHFIHNYTKNHILRIIEEASDFLFNNVLEHMKNVFTDQVLNCRANLTDEKDDSQSIVDLNEILNKIESLLDEKFKIIIESLINFKSPKLSFYKNSNFKEKISVKIREKIFVCSINFILTYLEEECSKPTLNLPLQLLLVFTKVLIDLELNIINNVLSNVDREFSIEKKESNYIITQDYEMKEKCKVLSQKLINKYVSGQGQNISFLIRKYIDTNDWLTNIEPNSIKSIMNRIIDDLNIIDNEVGQLFEEGNKADYGSDSSKKRNLNSQIFNSKPSYNKNTWSYGRKKIDNNLLSNIQKLFTERIEIFTDCELNKLSVNTGIIKILLKTFIECVRLCCFSKFGFQQIQIDVFYLQNQMWKFVSDENIIINLSDEILLSSYQRSHDPIKIKTNILEKICDSS